MRRWYLGSDLLAAWHHQAPLASRQRLLPGKLRCEGDRLELAGLRRPPCRPERPLIGTLLPSKRGRQVWIVEPPLSAGAWLTLDDPEPPLDVPES